MITFVSQCGLNGDDAAMLRLAVKRFCRIITFFSHVVLALRLCRNAAAETTWRIYDLVVITTKGQGQGRVFFFFLGRLILCLYCTSDDLSSNFFITLTQV